MKARIWGNKEVMHQAFHLSCYESKCSVTNIIGVTQWGYDNWRYSSMEIKKSNRQEMKKLKEIIAKRIEEKFKFSLEKKGTFLENELKSHRFFLAVSKLHDRSYKYFYGYYRRHIKFLGEVDHGYFVLGCLDSKRAFAIPKNKMDKLEKIMGSTGSGDNYHYHIRVKTEGNRHYIYASKYKNEEIFDINEFEI